jgi:hypothetical protein
MRLAEGTLNALTGADDSCQPTRVAEGREIGDLVAALAPDVDKPGSRPDRRRRPAGP